MPMLPQHYDVSVLPEGVSWINGASVSGAGADSVDHFNPATGIKTKAFSCASADTVDQACRAARAAFPKWRATAASARRNILLKIADLFEAQAEELSALTVIENGSPFSFAGFMSVHVPADWFRYYAGWADKTSGEVFPGMQEAGLNYSVRAPYGVVAIITAFNAPMSFIGMKVAAALAAGNCVVIKPSENAPWSALKFAEIAAQAGVPPGVVNVICGDASSASDLVVHPDVDKVSFTGSGHVASKILSATAPLLRPTSLELGGKSASILFDDCNIETAVGSAIFSSIALLSGQACIAGTRLLVQRPIYDSVLEAAVAIADSLKVGDPFDPETVLGPVISERERVRIEGFIEAAAGREDGRVILQGRRPGGDLSEGFFLTPTLFADVDPGSQLAQDEIFGPVLSIIPFDSDDDALAIANQSKFGLAGYAYTSSLDRALRAANEMDAGSITINKLNALPANMPFGGLKQSGFGREGGEEGFLEMTQSKAVQIAV